MIRITDTRKPKDSAGSIPIRDNRPLSGFSAGPRRNGPAKKFILWIGLKRIMALLLGLLLLLVLLTPLLIPWLATTLLAERLASALTRPVTIARAEFNPFTATLTLHRLIVGPKISQANDPVDPLLSAGKITMVLAPERLLAGEVACTLAGDHLFLHLVRQEDGRYNLGHAMDDLLGGSHRISGHFSCDTVIVNNSRLVFDDAPAGKTHLAENVSLGISSAATAQHPAGFFRFQATINAIPITLNDAAILDSVPPPAGSEPPAPVDAAEFPGPPVGPAAQTAEMVALVRSLSQATRNSLFTKGILPVAPRREHFSR